MKKILAVAVLTMCAAPIANASSVVVELVAVRQTAPGGDMPFTLNDSTATWALDTDTGVATQTGGIYSATLHVSSYSSPTIFTHTMTGAVLSSGTATASSWACTEGTFGAIVGSHICGNYYLSYDVESDTFTNNSIYTPTATGATVTIGGDDVAFGPPQTLANQYSNMSLVNLGGGKWRMTNEEWGPSFHRRGYYFDFAVVPIPASCLPFRLCARPDGRDAQEGQQLNVDSGPERSSESATIAAQAMLGWRVGQIVADSCGCQPGGRSGIHGRS
jgi:hypothetical protein